VVGLFCENALLALADAVHDPVRHPTVDGINPSKTDVKLRLDAYEPSRCLNSVFVACCHETPRRTQVLPPVFVIARFILQ